MQKKTFKTVLLVIIMIFTLSSTALAVETRPSLYLHSNGATTTVKDNAVVRINFNALGTGTMDSIGIQTITIEYSTDGTSWYTAKTYKSSTTSGMMGTNASSFSSYIDYSGTSGRYYRARVTLYAKKNGVSDSVQMLRFGNCQINMQNANTTHCEKENGGQ